MSRRVVLHHRARQPWLWSVLSGALVLTCLAGAVLLGNGSDGPNRSPAQMVTRRGTSLLLGNAPFRFVGYNEMLTSRSGHRCGRLFSDDEVETQIRQLHRVDRANGLRVWFYNFFGGPGDWRRFDLIVHQAEINDVKLVLTLANQLGDCEPFLDASQARDVKHLDWYTTGYKQPRNGNVGAAGGYEMSYRDFVRAVAKRYAHSPAILAWQLVNEADPQPRAAEPVTPSLCARALRSFADDMVSVIRSVDPRHLTSLGTYGAGGCGSYTSADYRYIHAGSIDLCEYHDYRYPSMALPGDDPHANLRRRISDCAAVGKPLFVGESGIGVGSGGSSERALPTPEARARAFDDKIGAAFARKAVGYLIWAREPSSGGFYDIAPGDPTQEVVARYGVRDR